MLRSPIVKTFADSPNGPLEFSAIIPDDTGEIQTRPSPRKRGISINEHFTRRQWIIIAVLYIGLMSVFLPVGILQPFYPVLAMSKGATPAQFGLVFGVFRLTMCLGSPLLGKFINHIGPRFMFTTGVLLVGGSSIIMGFVIYIANKETFLYESYAIQATSGLGTVMMAISATTMVNKEFPNDMGAVFGGIEISVGLGQVLGPLIGGAMYQYEGFTVPFLVFGSFILCVAVMAGVLLPGHYEKNVSLEKSKEVSLIRILKLPSMTIYILALVSVCIGNGFFNVTYEIHLQPLDLSPFIVSVMFALNSAMFCTSSWFSGLISDNWLSPMTVSLGGAILSLVSFLLLGPAPFLPIPYNLPLAVIANILFGIGNGTQVVATFSGMSRDAVAGGLPDTLAMHGYICGLWNCCFSLGGFMGFTLGGALLEALGYEWASVLLFGMECFIVSAICLFYLNGRRCIKSDGNETKSLLQSSGRRPSMLSVHI